MRLGRPKDERKAHAFKKKVASFFLSFFVIKTMNK